MTKKLNILYILLLLSAGSVYSSHELTDYSESAALTSMCCAIAASTSYLAPALFDKCLRRNPKGLRQIGREALTAGVVMGSGLGSSAIVASQLNLSPQDFENSRPFQMFCSSAASFCLYNKLNRSKLQKKEKRKAD